MPPSPGKSVSEKEIPGRLHGAEEKASVSPERARKERDRRAVGKGREVGGPPSGLAALGTLAPYQVRGEAVGGFWKDE